MHGDGAVAVVAVHGVGVHTPGDMARDIAALLQGANPETYSPFACSLLEIAVERPAGIQPPANAARHEEGAKPWYVRSAFVSRKVRAGPAPITDDIRFTQQAVEGVRIDADLSTYRTVLLRGERVLSNHAKPRAVDIYELSWSDLSQLGGFFARVLGEFYQILFHVASLGQKTVELAWSRAHEGSTDKKLLGFVLRAQTLTEWLLAGVIPILSLTLLLAVLPLAPVLLLDFDDWLELAIYLLATAVDLAILKWVTGMLIRRRTETEARAPRFAGVLGGVAWLLLLVASLFILTFPRITTSFPSRCVWPRGCSACCRLHGSCFSSLPSPPASAAELRRYSPHRGERRLPFGPERSASWRPRASSSS
jgi:hypothetical protein